MLRNYGFLLFFILLLLIVTFVLGFIAFSLMRKKFTRAKLSSYECGFEPYNDARKGFYISFYNIGLIFLLLDVELVLLLPALFSLNFITNSAFSWMILFILILVFGYIYEVYWGALRITYNN